MLREPNEEKKNHCRLFHFLFLFYSFHFFLNLCCTFECMLYFISFKRNEPAHCECINILKERRISLKPDNKINSNSLPTLVDECIERVSM